MSMPLVSIVVPCYNAERFVAEALGGALAQTHEAIEVIVVDDGSTDKSRRVIAGFRNRVRAIFGKNQGASAARNHGTAAAKGEYVQYLDADDRLEPFAVARRVEALERTGADVAYGGYRRLEEQADGQFLAGELVDGPMAEVHADPALAWLLSFWRPPAALLYRRSIIDKIGGWNERLPVIQDARFGFDAAEAGGRFVHVPGPGAEYRVVRQSLSRRDPAAFVRDVLTNALDIEARWRQANALTAPRRDALSQVFGYVSRELMGQDAARFEDAVSGFRRMRPHTLWAWPAMAGWLSRVAGPRLARRLLDRWSHLREAA